jgi:hypothetical protein
LFNRLIRLFVLMAFMAVFAVNISAQESPLCITSQPLPEMPNNAGSLCVVTSAIFRVEFQANGTLGTIGLVKGTQMSRLDEMAAGAVEKIAFIPKMVDGKPVTSFRILQYRYSWEYGWKAEPGPCQKDK